MFDIFAKKLNICRVALFFKRIKYLDLKQLFQNTTLLKGIVYILLIGQLSSNTLSYCYWMMDIELELIELSTLEDTESEEEDKKEEKKDEIRLDFYKTAYNELIAICVTLHNKDFLSLHHPDVSTPPPKFMLT